MNAYNRSTSALNTDYAAQIKDRLTMYDVVFTYLKSSVKRGYISCPFHSEKTASLYLWDDHFKCFGCGENGDIISFVRKYFNLDFVQALSKLNVDFDLRLPIGDKPTLRQVHEAQTKWSKLQAFKENREIEKSKLKCRYLVACKEYQRLKQNYNTYKPVSVCDSLNPLFVEALQKLDLYDYLTSNLSERISELDQPITV